MTEAHHLAVLLSFSGTGGVERMVLNLIDGLSRRGIKIDLLTIRADRLDPKALPAGIELIDLNVRHSGLAVAPLVAYLRRQRPAALLAAKDRAIRAAVIARRLAGWKGRLVGRLGTNLSAALSGQGRFRQRLRKVPMRLLYHGVDHIIAVSEGVADDTRTITGLDSTRISVVRNPVVTAQLPELAAAPCPHPWLDQPDTPTLLAVGRLTAQKDFATLVDAFALLLDERPARLIILGEGRLRATLEGQARRHGIADRVALPGYVNNPYAWMSRASLFVLSSAWEGSPNVLTEALALGVPAVATDCPSGPRELFDNGRYGTLVPVGDSAQLAAAMHTALLDPLPAQALKQAVRGYDVETAAAGYAQALGLAGNGH